MTFEPVGKAGRDIVKEVGGDKWEATGPPKSGTLKVRATTSSPSLSGG